MSAARMARSSTTLSLSTIVGFVCIGCCRSVQIASTPPRAPVAVANAPPATMPAWSALHSEVVSPEDDDPDPRPIGMVIHYPDPSLAEHFLAKGMPVDVTDDRGRTGLFVAIRHRRMEIATVFLEHGAD